jgi:predicted component of type VI protein secretion system
MKVRLVVEKGRTRTREVRLRLPQTTIGRQRGCGVRIPSQQVSRRHCLLTMQDGYLTVEDLDSVNGTLLNGQKITGRQVVRPGDRLEVGPIGFVVEYQLTREAVDRMANGGPTAPLAAPASVLDVMPIDEDGTFTEQPVALEEIPMALPEGEEDIPMLEALDDDYQQTASEGWSMPGGQELPDLLSELDGLKAESDIRKRSRRRG